MRLRLSAVMAVGWATGAVAQTAPPTFDEMWDACGRNGTIALCDAVTGQAVDAGGDAAYLAEAFYALGINRHNTGQDAEAIAAYSQAIAQAPRASMYFNRAQLYRFDGQMQAAEEDLREAVVLRPDYGKAWIDLSLIYVDSNRPELAIEAAATGIARDGDLSDRFVSMGWFNTGLANWRLDRLPEAAQAWTSATEADPSNGRAFGLLIRTYETMGDSQAAAAAQAAATRAGH